MTMPLFPSARTSSAFSSGVYVLCFPGMTAVWGRDSIGLGSGTKVKKYAGFRPELDLIVRRTLPRTPWIALEQ